MEAKATTLVNATLGKMGSLFRGSDLSVRSRLIACFVLIVLLMIAVDAIAVWQYWKMAAPAQRVSSAEQTSQAVVRVHLDVDTFRDSMAALASSHDLRQFSGEAASIRQTFLSHVDHAEQMLRANPDIEKDAPISSALESLRGTLLLQLDTAVQLAAVGEWNAVQSRLAVQIPSLIEFSSMLVERVDQQALQQRSQAIEDAQKERQRLFIILPSAALLTLLAAAALGWYVTRTIVCPLSVLTASAEALARGDFQHKVDLRGNNELAVLGDAFNYAARQLQKLYENLRGSERELRGVINTVPAHVWSASPDGTVDFINERLLEFVGLSSDDILGWNWESVLHCDDRAKFVTGWRMAVRDGRSIESEVRVRRADGEYRWWFCRNVPLRDEKGNVVKWYGTGIDIDDRKRAEEALRQAQADLAHINRVSTLGELAASIAHELKQPIAAAITNAKTCSRWLTREEPNLPEAREGIRRVVNDSNRAAEIINRLTNFYKKGDLPKREPVDVNEVACEMVVLLHSEATRYSISMRTELTAELPKIQADRVQLQQVFMNLMLNGIEAMNEAGGELSLKTQRSDDAQVMISISDTGIGLPAEKVDQIFSTFFTTKSQGTGMGLSISRTIVEAHGGRLWATTNPGRGATFHFALPAEVKTSSTSAT